MGRFLQFIIALLYFVCSFMIPYIVIQASWEISPKDTMLIFLISFMGCLSSIYWRMWLYLLKENVRQPIAEERDLLRRNFNLVCERCGERRKFRLLIEETKIVGAYAIGLNTIVISRMMLDEFSDSEIQAVMAHELGHLRSGDCVIQCFIRTAWWLPIMLERTGKFCWLLATRTLRNFYIVILTSITLALLVYAFQIKMVLFIYFGTAVLLAKILRLVFYYIWLSVMRFTEYRQDAFAVSLGYADDLRTALLKLARDVAGDISIWHTWQHSSHPIIYNRIRRLEEFVERLKASETRKAQGL